MEAGRTEIRIAGFGGQGVVLAGLVLGRAAMLDGRQVVQQQSYGAEARGGGARSELVLADEAILYPEVVGTDLMIVLSQVAIDKYGDDLRPGGHLIYESELVASVPAGLHDRARGAPFTAIANRELGTAIAANMVALGFATAATGIVTRAHLEQAVEESVPKGTGPKNLQALATGWELAAAPVTP